jgi:hypothetical protein
MLLTIPETCKDWLQTMLAPPQHALCDENVAWIQQELDDDEAGYVQHTRSEFLPTRLLDVEADAHTESVRLIETTTMVTCPRYLALSYCWGDQSAAALQLKTTSSTLRKHLDSLPSDRTTNIVHDAVKVARALHVRYLWIDALCIIQDDGEDWARESRVMGLVYTNAYATICALASSSCLEGFVVRNDPEVRIQTSQASCTSIDNKPSTWLETAILFCLTISDSWTKKLVRGTVALGSIRKKGCQNARSCSENHAFIWH